MHQTLSLADPDREGSAAILLGMGFRAMTDRFHELLRAEGHEPLRPAHGFVFRLLERDGDLTATQLATRLSVTRQAAARVAAELEEWGYLTRRAHPRDGRAQVLVLTPRGRRYVAHADELWARVEREWAAVAGAEAVHAAKRALAAYVEVAAGEGEPPLRPVW
ncbi:MarR family winged helix-turn-helix transcriptional regulator [Conexibacter woesei]|uniref:Transcriptional regulator, MarR family n=1 Tax=Conexibacter woesei (strain DSM 14684 / CCUG 47730 / CIP 108061 / JCM 11494 / NBRC 100937 / ID131577) TaxID=469383 RepID=D3F949_CONWI|nr:MarR family transcriptional regulator [Conexibacter woesei]ADB53044.1 transcriptional regulator, MarR family [Conexibacter woesei DSM 14684]